MLDEGYIKFSLVWDQAPALEVPQDLLDVRDRLCALGLVGMYADSGIGFGNVSIRLKEGEFLISGSGTGAVGKSHPGLFSRVVSYDIPGNQVACIGPVPASSESLTHAMLYACDSAIGSVLHVHQLELWRRMLNYLPTTAADIPYGTPGMALEVKKLYAAGPLRQQKILVMAGHEEGLIAFGKDTAEALKVIEKWL
jgi:L-ribulose-5-phosphate 4-epimerase